MEKFMIGNVIVGQSGGPTAVINSSLAGVYQTARDRGAKKVYGMLHGIKGLLDRQYVDLSHKIRSTMEIDLLKRTPSSYLGSCRYKLPDVAADKPTYEKIFSILKELEIEYFFYIGGNDSMDTIAKLSQYAEEVKSPIRFIGVPKTIDNDLAITDHTPGFGSAAKFIASTMKEIIRDGLVYDYPTVSYGLSFFRRDVIVIDSDAYYESLENAKKDMNLSNSAFVNYLGNLITKERNPASKVKTGIQYLNAMFNGRT